MRISDWSSDVCSSDLLEATLSHTWTDARDVTAGQPLGRVPKHKITLSAVARPIEAWSISPEVTYVSRQWDFLYPDGAGFGDNGYNDGYALVNLATTYRLDDTY